MSLRRPTPHAVEVRRGPASWLRYYCEMEAFAQGHLVEESVRLIAGWYGVPDFVYRPVQHAVRSGTREVSDGLLVAGDRGVIVQVKSRDRSRAVMDSPQRAEAWCAKEGARGADQGRGTRRTISGGAVRVRSLRGYERVLPAAKNWPIVVVLDHRNAPPVTFLDSADILFISYADWRELHELIRSTVGVIDYVERALSSGISVALGLESRRYRALAAADSAWAEEIPTGVPILPAGRMAAADRQAADFFDELVEKVADSRGAIGWDDQNYLLIVEQLDQVPVGTRARLGTKLIATLEKVSPRQPSHGFWYGDRQSSARLCFRCELFERTTHGPDGEDFLITLTSYCALRHSQAIEAGWNPEVPTLAIGLLHDPMKGTRYVFASLRGDDLPCLPDDVREALERQYGVFTGDAVVVPVGS